MAEMHRDQYAFRPTGSTTAALVDLGLLQKVTDMLQQHEHVVLVTVDFSKASDSVKHLSHAKDGMSPPAISYHYRPETENSEYILLEEALYKCSITFELHFLALSSSR